MTLEMMRGGLGTGLALSKVKQMKAQSLSYAPGGEHVRPNKMAVPKLDMGLLDTISDPTHRYNYSARSLTHDERKSTTESARNTYRPNIAPAWLKHDRQVLRFSGYFQEPVYEDPKENYRVRSISVYFYLEDGTMMIDEPKIENAGIPQGCFVKRHRIPKAGGQYYTYQDLKCGVTISVYSRAFRLTGCDDFTRYFYAHALGVDVGQEEEQPEDAFVVDQQNALSARSPQISPMSPSGREIAEGKMYTELANGGARKNAKLQQYLENDRKVLSFKGYWDDTTRYGCRNYYTIHYYLADDTVEALENLARNSGRDPYPVFWRRAPLRKNPHMSPAPGMQEPEPIPYKPEDFIVGQTISMYNREIVLFDCDDFTRDFYRQYTGEEQGKIHIQNPPPKHVQLVYPPHTGFGTEEDSLASCKHLTPRPPRRDVNKLMNESHKILRFLARTVNDKPEDEDRRFVIGFYIADSTIGVWEVKQRNSGHAEGQFAQKSRKRNPATGEWFAPADFAIGNILEVNSTPFELLSADERTVKYMEDNVQEFQK
jgi:hypothetical protein